MPLNDYEIDNFRSYLKSSMGPNTDRVNEIYYTDRIHESFKDAIIQLTHKVQYLESQNFSLIDGHDRLSKVVLDQALRIDELQKRLPPPLPDLDLDY